MGNRKEVVKMKINKINRKTAMKIALFFIGLFLLTYVIINFNLEKKYAMETDCS